MGRRWAAKLRESGVQIAAWVDPLPGAVEAAVELLPESQSFPPPSVPDLASALQHYRADFVVDVSPPAFHPSVTALALSYGLPVLGEKPMATTMEDARRMLEASEAAGLPFMVSQNVRFRRGARKFRQAIHKEIGPVELLTTDYFIAPHFGGFREEMLHPLLVDVAIHAFDLARYLTGSDPVTVSAQEFNPTWSWYSGAAGAVVTFEMTGGVRYLYRGLWCAEGCATSWGGQWRGVGPRGSAVWDGEEAIRCETSVGEFSSNQLIRAVIDRSGSVASAPDTEPEDLAGSLAEFLRCLVAGESPMTECHDNIKSLAMMLGAVEAAESGQMVALSGQAPLASKVATSAVQANREE